LPASEFKPIRFEFVAPRIALMQSLPLCDEHADRLL
jgi:hypothetical protein